MGYRRIDIEKELRKFLAGEKTATSPDVLLQLIADDYLSRSGGERKGDSLGWLKALYCLEDPRG